MLQLSQEMSGGSARLRVDVYGPNPVDYVLEDMNFLNYRLAAVNIEPEVKLDEPDIVWNQDGDKSISYDGKTGKSNNEKANAQVGRKYRDGWKPKALG